MVRRLRWLWVRWSRPVRYFMTDRGFQSGYVIRTDGDRMILRRSREQLIVHSVLGCKEVDLDSTCGLMRPREAG